MDKSRPSSPGAWLGTHCSEDTQNQRRADLGKLYFQTGWDLGISAFNGVSVAVWCGSH